MSASEDRGGSTIVPGRNAPLGGDEGAPLTCRYRVETMMSYSNLGELRYRLMRIAPGSR